MWNTHRLVKSMNESLLRSTIKSIVWRIIGIFILGFISFAITKSWEQTTWITVIFHSIRTVLYIIHERLWLRVMWGRY